MYELISTNLVTILGVLGMLAFAVSLVTQLIKDLPGISKVPTKLFVMIISLIICVSGLLVYGAYAGVIILWHYVVLAVFTSFVVSYISIYGWETFAELYKRFAKVDIISINTDINSNSTSSEINKSSNITAEKSESN